MEGGDEQESVASAKGPAASMAAASGLLPPGSTAPSTMARRWEGHARARRGPLREVPAAQARQGQEHQGQEPAEVEAP
eukprot:10659670-Alexandrium_andersonii.AAC.1